VTPKRPAIVPVEVWEQAPEAVQVVIRAMVEYYEQRIAKLEAEVRQGRRIKIAYPVGL
jgi:hypothetical protein